MLFHDAAYQRRPPPLSDRETGTGIDAVKKKHILWQAISTISILAVLLSFLKDATWNVWPGLPGLQLWSISMLLSLRHPTFNR